jgi:diguanylate cyclase (GGDEF)-like protein
LDPDFRRSFYVRFREEAVHQEGHGDVLVAVNDPVAIRVLAGEIARMATEEPSERLFLLLDTHTAMEMESLIEGACKAADTLYLVGRGAAPFMDLPTVHRVETADGVDAHDRFFAVLSNHLSLAVMGCRYPEIMDGETEFRGGWTGQRSCVERLFLSLLGDMTSGVFEETRGDPSQIETDFSHATQLMSAWTDYLSSIQHDVILDKTDLSRVLEILKAVSAKRRSHDVLYVFVEQISRIVDMHRCSVVQVWGSAGTGHVLASHDDERISDLVIELDKYPEIPRAIGSGGRVVINRTDRDPLTREFAEELRLARIHSLLVVPIVLNDAGVGSLLLRAARRDRSFSLREIGFCEVVAEAAANALERAYLFERIQQANERLEKLAVTDGLTGLRNHRSFRERLDDEFERAVRYDIPLSLMILDLDDFKAVNDTHGHLQGDAVLREMAKRIGRVIRKSDLIARYGGEEFTVILPQTGHEGAMAQAGRLLDEIRNSPFPGMPPDSRVTASIGVSTLLPGAMPEPESFIKAADAALYEAKRSGKDCAKAGPPQGEAT